jgi:hypothetical protein
LLVSNAEVVREDVEDGVVVVEVCDRDCSCLSAYGCYNELSEVEGMNYLDALFMKNQREA